MLECPVPGGTMFERDDEREENLAEKFDRLYTVLKWEISHEAYSNAWVTLHWLTTTKNILGYRKVRVRETDIALMLLEAKDNTQQDFDINWKGVTCV